MFACTQEKKRKGEHTILTYASIRNIWVTYVTLFTSTVCIAYLRIGADNVAYTLFSAFNHDTRIDVFYSVFAGQRIEKRSILRLDDPSQTYGSMPPP